MPLPLLFVIFWLTPSLGQVAPPEPWYGDYLGRFNDPKNIGIKGEVYVVNDTCIQVRSFTYNGEAPDLYFWIDQEGTLTGGGIRLNTFEFGPKALGVMNNVTVILNVPHDFKVQHFRTFGLWCHAFSQNFGQVSIPEGITPPKPSFLTSVLDGKRYNVGSGPILVMDRRTVKIYGFTFDGKRAPDGYFFVGRGDAPKHGLGVKVPIRGRDKPDMISPVKDVFNGGQDVILELPEGFDIYSIDWISVYCYRFRADFGYARVQNVSLRIPPYVPEQILKSDEGNMAANLEPWPVTTLLGKEPRLSFTLQLGPPGGVRGYKSMAQAQPGAHVWYVNGYMTPELFLQRGITYTFIVEGGDDQGNDIFYNPLYISDEPFGGYSKLSPDEAAQVRIFAGVDNFQKPLMGPVTKSLGRICVWSSEFAELESNSYEDFSAFKEGLRLQCQPGSPGKFTWTPDSTTPDVVYYQSYTNYYMGWKIMVVDEIPQDLPDFRDGQYIYEEMELGGPVGTATLSPNQAGAGQLSNQLEYNSKAYSIYFNSFSWLISSLLSLVFSTLFLYTR